MFRAPLHLLALLLPLLAAACAGAGAGLSTGLECAPYARSVSGIALYGDAADWWAQADGRYPRAQSPSPGSVMVLDRGARLPHGHVAIVRDQVSAREIRVDQANWVHGRLTQDEPVVDVSPDNDWSAVRVWWAPAGALGASVYPVLGFVSR